MFPVCFPHEMLGYDRGDLKGIFLSFKIMSKIVKQDNSSGTKKGKQNSRFAKWKQNKGGGQ